LKYKRPQSTREELLRTIRKLFDENMRLRKKVKVTEEFLHAYLGEK
jgi:hypothetical protein